MDQRALVERARRGDHDAFAALVDPALARLDAAARLILRDPELARDAVQEALIRAWRDLPGLRDPDRFDAWLHRLTVNACLDLVRRRRAPRRSRSSSLRSIRRRRPTSPAPWPTASSSTRRSGASIPAIARSSRCTTSSGCRCQRWRRPWASPSGRPSPACTTRSRAMRVTVDGRTRPGPGHRPGRAGRMTSRRRFERHLPALLEDLYLGPSPDYRDDVLGRPPCVAAAPAWTFPGRWLPMADIATAPRSRRGCRGEDRVASCSSSPARRSRPSRRRLATDRLPAPFGPAATGSIAYASDGDIYAVDPVERARHARRHRAGGRQPIRVFAGRDQARVRPAERHGDAGIDIVRRALPMGPARE